MRLSSKFCYGSEHIRMSSKFCYGSEHICLSCIFCCRSNRIFVSFSVWNRYQNFRYGHMRHVLSVEISLKAHPIDCEVEGLLSAHTSSDVLQVKQSPDTYHPFPRRQGFTAHLSSLSFNSAELKNPSCVVQYRIASNTPPLCETAQDLKKRLFFLSYSTDSLRTRPPFLSEERFNSKSPVCCLYSTKLLRCSAFLSLF